MFNFVDVYSLLLDNIYIYIYIYIIWVYLITMPIISYDPIFLTPGTISVDAPGCTGTHNGRYTRRHFAALCGRFHGSVT